jgi:hypothetical protein
MAEKKEEIRISYFDPVANAYREIPLELAKKFVEEAKRIEKEIEAIKKEEK